MQSLLDLAKTGDDHNLSTAECRIKYGLSVPNGTRVKGDVKRRGRPPFEIPENEIDYWLGRMPKTPEGRGKVYKEIMEVHELSQTVAAKVLRELIGEQVNS